MEENNQKLGVGLVVVASTIIGIALVLYFGKMGSMFVSRYRVTINFPSAPQVNRDTPVRKSGVQIGRVADVKLLEDNQGVNLVLELDRNVKLAQGETCRITIGSLITNEAIVEFIQPTQSVLLNRFDGVAGGAKNNALDPEEYAFAQSTMADGDYLRGGVVAGNPLDLIGNMQGNFANTLSAIEQASLSVKSLAGTMENALGGGEGQLQGLAQKIDTTIDNFNQTVLTFDRIGRQVETANLPQALGDAASRLPLLFNEVERTLTQAQSTLRGFEDFGQSLQEISGEFKGIGDEARLTLGNANRALGNIADFTEPLSANSEEIVGKAMKTFDNLDVTLGELRTFAQRLNQGNGTLARLIEDDEMYYEAKMTLENIRRTTDGLAPILDDVRVFTNKAARDPSQFGVKGVFGANPKGAGLK
jgi:phospholipid/cholesterol/gamma-HCH transport system substrate-binding protein